MQPQRNEVLTWEEVDRLIDHLMPQFDDEYRSDGADHPRRDHPRRDAGGSDGDHAYPDGGGGFPNPDEDGKSQADGLAAVHPIP